MELDQTRSPTPEQLGQWQLDLLWGMHKKDGLRPAQVELLFAHIAAVSGKPAPSPTPGEAEDDLRAIEPYCWTPFRLCVFCNADRYPEGDGHRQEHKPDCPIATLRRHLEPQPIESAPRAWSHWPTHTGPWWRISDSYEKHIKCKAAERALRIMLHIEWIHADEIEPYGVWAPDSEKSGWLWTPVLESDWPASLNALPAPANQENDHA